MSPRVRAACLALAAVWAVAVRVATEPAAPIGTEAAKETEPTPVRAGVSRWPRSC